VYVKIGNRGTIASTGNEHLCLHWSKASSGASWPENWCGAIFPGQTVPKGDRIDSVRIPVIPPDSSIVLEIPWTTPDPTDYYFAGKEVWHFCLLGRVIAENDPMFIVEGSDLEANTRNNNNIAWVNINFLMPVSGEISSSVSSGNPFNVSHPFSLNFTPEDGSDSISEEAEITVKLSDVLYQIWLRGGAVCVNMIHKGNQIFLVTGKNASLRNLFFEPEEWGLVTVQFNFLTRKITPQVNYTYHLVQTDALNEKVIGGEVYQITKSPRTPFYAYADDVYAFQNEPITLTATSIGEPAVYNWYDIAGNLVCKDIEFTTTATDQTTYKLEVIATADGYKDYANVEVRIIPGKIESIFPNPTSDVVTVMCVFNNVSDAYIQISDYFKSPPATIPLNTSPQSVIFDMQNYPIGTYMVTMVCDGVVVDVKTFVKH
jgi:hypothetical protein